MSTLIMAAGLMLGGYCLARLVEWLSTRDTRHDIAWRSPRPRCPYSVADTQAPLPPGVRPMRYDERDQHAEPNPEPDPSQRSSHRIEPRPRKRRRWPWIVVGILAFLIIGGIVAGGSVTPQQTNSGVGQGGTITPAPAGTDDAGAPPPVTAEDAAATIKYGATHDYDGLALTASEPKAGSAALGATYCTKVNYVNNREDPVAFSIFDWKLVDTDGVESTAGFTGTSDPNAGLGQGNLRPGGKKAGTVCFDKQGDGTPAQLIFQGGLIGDPVVWSKQAG